MRKIVTLVVCLAVATLFAMLLFYLPALAQSQLSLQAKDPGVRAGSVDAGRSGGGALLAGDGEHGRRATAGDDIRSW